MSKRKSLTTRQRVELFMLRKGVCSICRCKIVNKPWDADHRVPLAMGGSNELSNYEVAHVACHREKSKRDVRDIAKAVRVQARHIGAKRSRNPMPGSRQSKFKKHMDGRVTLR